jgi:hypothetical protein
VAKVATQAATTGFSSVKLGWGENRFETRKWLVTLPSVRRLPTTKGRINMHGKGKTHVITLIRVFLFAVVAAHLAAQTVDQLIGKNVSIAQTNYKGRSAIELVAAPQAANDTSYAVIKGASFKDGTIEIDLAGKPAANAGEGARGFIGIAFRIQDDGKHEYIYLRPTNGRADDQVRRNHSTQYSSHPDFDFARSRQEAPGKYESYVDLEPGAWTKYKIEVEGRKARLYVNGAEQPCLIVNDLKLEPHEGGVALWVGPGTEGYFSNLKITAK